MSLVLSVRLRGARGVYYCRWEGAWPRNQFIMARISIFSLIIVLAGYWLCTAGAIRHLIRPGVRAWNKIRKHRHHVKVGPLVSPTCPSLFGAGHSSSHCFRAEPVISVTFLWHCVINSITSWRHYPGQKITTTTTRPKRRRRMRSTVGTLPCGWSTSGAVRWTSMEATRLPR